MRRTVSFPSMLRDRSGQVPPHSAAPPPAGQVLAACSSGGYLQLVMEFLPLPMDGIASKRRRWATATPGPANFPNVCPGYGKSLLVLVAELFP